MTDPNDLVDDESSARARLGQTLNDKWTLERLLGVGGMAAVYEARHRNGARAALKILHPALALQPTLRERFVHEGYAANRVEHPDVVKITDDDVISGGPEDGVPFLVLELLDGESLEARISRPPPVTERELLELVDVVLGVLESAHAKGIIHRDLKPENLFLVADPESERPRVKVVDFGIARSIENRGNTVHGVPMGTPAFMAPEQAAGRIDEIDGRTDLFALGATMWAVLSGRNVHEGEDPLDVMYKVAKEQAPPLRSVAPNVSERCAAIVDRALRLDRGDRYPDATAMRDDVRALLASMPEPPKVELPPSPRPPASSIETAPTLFAEPSPPPRSLPESSIPPPPKTGGCGVFVLLLLALLAAGAVAAWFALGKPTSWPPSGAPEAGVTDAPLETNAARDAENDAPLSAPSVDASMPAVDASPPDATSDASEDATATDGSPEGGGVRDAAVEAASFSPKPTATTRPTAKPTATTRPTAKPTGKPKH